MTRRQSQLLAFIESRISDDDGVCPSFEEMRDALGLKAKSGIHRILAGLEERGYIRRRRYGIRSIVVVKSGIPAARRLENLVGELVRDEGPTRTAAALLDLAAKITPATEAA
jgi:SOS-response transcriptional repressor LexA